MRPCRAGQAAFLVVAFVRNTVPVAALTFDRDDSPRVVLTDEGSGEGGSKPVKASRLSGLMEWEKGGRVRIVLETLVLSKKSHLIVHLVNEGERDLAVEHEDVWKAVMKDGSRIALERRSADDSDSKTGQLVVASGTYRTIDLSPKGGGAGEIACLEYGNHEHSSTVVVGESFTFARPVLEMPPEYAGGFDTLGGQLGIPVTIVVGANGRAERVIMEKPEADVRSEHNMLLAAIQAAIMKWQFEPARLDGIPQRSLYLRTFQISPWRVVRRVFAGAPSELEARIARLLKASMPYVVDIPQAHGFAIAVEPEKGKGIEGATAWLVRVGGQSGADSSWVVVTSLSLLGHGSQDGGTCECWMAQDGAPEELMEQISSVLKLRTIESTTLAPQEGCLIPSGIAESKAAGSWRRAAIRKLLVAALTAPQENKTASGKERHGSRTSQALPESWEFLQPQDKGPTYSLDDMTGFVSPPRLTKKVVPTYPEAARLKHIEGKVVLQAVIDAEGNVGTIDLVRPMKGLNLAAVDGVCKWKYKPAMLGGKPVPVLFNVTVEFSLR